MLKPIRQFVFVVMSVLSLSVATNARAQLEPVIAVVDVDAVIRDSQAMTTLGAQLLGQRVRRRLPRRVLREAMRQT